MKSGKHFITPTARENTNHGNNIAFKDNIWHDHEQ